MKIFPVSVLTEDAQAGAERWQQVRPPCFARCQGHGIVMVSCL